MFLRELQSILLASGMLTLTACATIPPPDYAGNHPANPNAQAASVEPASSTLSSYRAGNIGSKADAASSDSPSEHEGHATHDHSQSTPQDTSHGDH